MSLASFQSLAVRLTPKVTSLIYSQAPKALTPVINEQLKCYYSNSRYRKAPLRRRKGGVAPPPPEPTLFHDPIEEESPSLSPSSITSDPKEFSARANDLLERVHTAVLPMKKFNDVFDVHLQPEETEDRELSIRLDPKFGSFSLRVDNDSMTVQLTSPISGYLEYVPCSKTGEWCNTEDSHDLIGLVVRDLIRNCNGLPKF